MLRARAVADKPTNQQTTTTTKPPPPPPREAHAGEERKSHFAELFAAKKIKKKYYAMWQLFWKAEASAGHYDNDGSTLEVRWRRVVVASRRRVSHLLLRTRDDAREEDED